MPMKPAVRDRTPRRPRPGARRSTVASGCRAWAFVALGLAGCEAGGAARDAPPDLAADREPSDPQAEDEGFDISDFLDRKYGFLPVAIPITEPAVGYGLAGGLAFISSPLGDAAAGSGRPDITFVGGFGTENGSSGFAVGDVRYWLDDRLQTVAGFFDASVGLDFHGIGDGGALAARPLGYELGPTGGLLQGKYRIGDTALWVGLAYAFAATDVVFEANPGTPGLPEFASRTDVGGLVPSLTWDTRDNVFTPTAGTYVEASLGLFAPAFGADAEYQRARLLLMEFVPLDPTWFLGLRGDLGASFGDMPFFLRPFVYARGVPAMRYQGEEIAQIEAELRWQAWNRVSLVGFGGVGAAWRDFDAFDGAQAVGFGGFGVRYELARKYGIHAGLDLAFSEDDAAVYVQFGSAWMRP
jgi:hypothetical protein